MSESEVSRRAAVLDDQAKELRAGTFDRACPCVWLDAIRVKVRECGRGVSKAVPIAMGVNVGGEREVLGVQVADNGGRG
jgi:putative transposase